MADENARNPASAEQAAIERARSTTEARADIAGRSMANQARDNHGILARLSHLAALTAERLQEAAQSPAGLDQATLEGVLSNLREIQNDGHLGYRLPADRDETARQAPDPRWKMAEVSRGARDRH